VWLQQDGAPAHFGGAAFLHRQFPDRLVGRGGPVACPARSSDLTLMNYFLWGHIKPLVYVKRSGSRSELIYRILDAAYQIINDQETVMTAVTSTVERAQTCVDNHCGDFEDARRT
jgi:hypothetical protein